MALTKQVCERHVTATKFGDLEIREEHCYLEDGQVMASNYHRRVITSGSDVSQESERIQALYAAAQLNKVERPENGI